MKKIKIGVLGAYRGTSMINYCKRSDNAKVVAICDKSPDAIEAQKQHAEGLDITFYDNFEDFIKHDMDAVVLANYAHQHAPFAIRAMHEGKHVFSEVLPVQTMKEAVELIEAVEQTGMVYAYGENYCYMPCTAEMTKLYAENKIGELEYAECEYVHNGETIWPSITYGEKDHWRNNMYSTFYCTHSLGPVIHASKLRPVSVIGIESTKNARRERVGARGGSFGIEMVTLENGAIVKSIHGGLYRNSIWYSLYGSKGRMESGRPNCPDGAIEYIYVSADEFDGEYANRNAESYNPTRPLDENAEGFGHAGSDFYSMYHFIEYLRGNKHADVIDVYEAMDMFLPGMFAFRSILNGSTPMDIPNLRDPAEREKWRNDVACTDPEVAGDQLLPTRKGGTPDIPDAVYDRQLQLWLQDKNSDSGYHAMATTQGSKK
ncbi:MAG: Gfo/Idh/MocA family oxidoreductase [Clostridia bacterium]|nr:Gfo/Idh/MocA family oxidoreductase [Clostridia bacterium]